MGPKRRAQRGKSTFSQDQHTFALEILLYLKRKICFNKMLHNLHLKNKITTTKSTLS